MYTQDKKYNGWLWALKLCAVRFFQFKDSTVFSPDHWKPYYDQGLTVMQALQEDFKYVK